MLEFDQVDFVYPKGTQVLKRISFHLEKGSTLGVLGLSGSGKSTIAKLACSLLKPTAGKLAVRGRVQMIFQNPMSSLNPKWTIKKILEEPLKIHNIKKAPSDILLEVGLDPDMLSRTPLQLSGGQCQRVAVARALSLSPDILIADEATCSLDSQSETLILELLKSRQQKENFALLMISHHIDLVRDYSDKLIVLHQGNIIEKGLTKEIYNAPASNFTKLLFHPEAHGGIND